MKKVGNSDGTVIIAALNEEDVGPPLRELGVVLEPFDNFSFKILSVKYPVGTSPLVFKYFVTKTGYFGETMVSERICET